MDPLGQVVLSELKKIGIEDAIIAGGYVRDYLLGGCFKDIDVFVPIRRTHELENLVYGNPKFEHSGSQTYKNPETGLVEFVPPKTRLGAFTDFQIKFGEDYGSINRFVGLYDCKIHDNIPVQIIGYNFPKESFADELIEEFDYNINKCYYDGSELIQHEDCKKDIDRGVATLDRLSHPSELFRAIEKFRRMQVKYPKLLFRTTLKITDRRSEKEDLHRERNENRRNIYSKLYGDPPAGTPWTWTGGTTTAGVPHGVPHPAVGNPGQHNHAWVDEAPETIQGFELPAGGFGLQND